MSKKYLAGWALLAIACLSGCAGAPIPVEGGPAYRSPAYNTPAYLGPQAGHGTPLYTDLAMAR